MVQTTAMTVALCDPVAYSVPRKPAHQPIITTITAIERLSPLPVFYRQARGGGSPSSAILATLLGPAADHRLAGGGLAPTLHRPDVQTPTYAVQPRALKGANSNRRMAPGLLFRAVCIVDVVPVVI